MHEKSKIESIDSKLALEENLTLSGRSDEFSAQYTAFWVHTVWSKFRGFHGFSFTEIVLCKRLCVHSKK